MTVRILTGDCRMIMATLPENSVDAIVTDPPYGLGFMGKAWDRFTPGDSAMRRRPELDAVNAGAMRQGGRQRAGADYQKRQARDMRAFQAWCQEWAEQALRVLKPGGHLLSFGGTRTYHRMACAIEDAGFEIRDQVGWLYGSGFPKSLDVAKAIDSRKDWAGLRRLHANIKAARDRLGISQSEAARRMGLIAPGETLGGGGFMWFESGLRLPTREQYPALKAALQLGDECDEAFTAAEREVIGQHHDSAPGQNMQAGIGGRDSKIPAGEITTASTAAARQWQGWGTALKPAWEPICMARKPLAGTVAANVLEHRTGALNIDGCRVAFDAGDDAGSWGDGRRPGGFGDVGHASGASVPGQRNDGGRWPANLMHDGSDEVLAAFPEDTVSGAMKREVPAYEGESSTGFLRGRSGPSNQHGDRGSAARFFYTAKASRHDRNEGLQGLPEKPLLWSSGEQNPGSFQSAGTKRAAANNHPTVKPTDLMRYLCRLVTPPGGTVLDPFAGSGSTLKAAELEGFDAIGIELDPAYVEIARRRIAGDAPLFADVEVAQ